MVNFNFFILRCDYQIHKMQQNKNDVFFLRYLTLLNYTQFKP